MKSKIVIFMDTCPGNKESTMPEKIDLCMLEKKHFKLRLENQEIDIQYYSNNMLLFFGQKENLNSDEYEFLVIPEFNSLYLPIIIFNNNNHKIKKNNQTKILNTFFCCDNEDYIIQLIKEYSILSYYIFNISYIIIESNFVKMV